MNVSASASEDDKNLAPRRFPKLDASSRDQISLSRQLQHAPAPPEDLLKAIVEDKPRRRRRKSATGSVASVTKSTASMSSTNIGKGSSSRLSVASRSSASSGGRSSLRTAEEGSSNSFTPASTTRSPPPYQENKLTPRVSPLRRVLTNAPRRINSSTSSRASTSTPVQPPSRRVKVSQRLGASIPAGLTLEPLPENQKTPPPSTGRQIPSSRRAWFPRRTRSHNVPSADRTSPAVAAGLPTMTTTTTTNTRTRGGVGRTISDSRNSLRGRRTHSHQQPPPSPQIQWTRTYNRVNNTPLKPPSKKKTKQSSSQQQQQILWTRSTRNSVTSTQSSPPRDTTTTTTTTGMSNSSRTTTRRQRDQWHSRSLPENLTLPEDTMNMSDRADQAKKAKEKANDKKDRWAMKQWNRFSLPEQLKAHLPHIIPGTQAHQQQPQQQQQQLAALHHQTATEAAAKAAAARQNAMMEKNKWAVEVKTRLSATTLDIPTVEVGVSSNNNNNNNNSHQSLPTNMMDSSARSQVASNKERVGDHGAPPKKDTIKRRSINSSNIQQQQGDDVSTANNTEAERDKWFQQWNRLSVSGDLFVTESVVGGPVQPKKTSLNSSNQKDDALLLALTMSDSDDDNHHHHHDDDSSVDTPKVELKKKDKEEQHGSRSSVTSSRSSLTGSRSSLKEHFAQHDIQVSSQHTDDDVTPDITAQPRRSSRVGLLSDSLSKIMDHYDDLDDLFSKGLEEAEALESVAAPEEDNKKKSAKAKPRGSSIASFNYSETNETMTISSRTSSTSKKKKVTNKTGPEEPWPDYERRAHSLTNLQQEQRKTSVVARSKRRRGNSQPVRTIDALMQDHSLTIEDLISPELEDTTVVDTPPKEGQGSPSRGRVRDRSPPSRTKRSLSPQSRTLLSSQEENRDAKLSGSRGRNSERSRSPPGRTKRSISPQSRPMKPSERASAVAARRSLPTENSRSDPSQATSSQQIAARRSLPERPQREDTPPPSPLRRKSKPVPVLQTVLNKYDDMESLFSRGLEDASATVATTEQDITEPESPLIQIEKPKEEKAENKTKSKTKRDGGRREVLRKMNVRREAKRSDEDKRLHRKKKSSNTRRKASGSAVPKEHGSSSKSGSQKKRTGRSKKPKDTGPTDSSTSIKHIPSAFDGSVMESTSTLGNSSRRLSQQDSDIFGPAFTMSYPAAHPPVTKQSGNASLPIQMHTPQEQAWMEYESYNFYGNSWSPLSIAGHSYHSQPELVYGRLESQLFESQPIYYNQSSPQLQYSRGQLRCNSRRRYSQNTISRRGMPFRKGSGVGNDAFDGGVSKYSLTLGDVFDQGSLHKLDEEREAEESPQAPTSTRLYADTGLKCGPDIVDDAELYLNLPWRTMPGLAVNQRAEKKEQKEKLAKIEIDDTFHWRYRHKEAFCHKTALDEKPLYQRPAKDVLLQKEHATLEKNSHRGRNVSADFHGTPGHDNGKNTVSEEEKDGDDESSICYPSYNPHLDASIRNESGSVSSLIV